jgi:hypothetical protein
MLFFFSKKKSNKNNSEIVAQENKVLFQLRCQLMRFGIPQDQHKCDIWIINFKGGHIVLPPYPD